MSCCPEYHLADHIQWVFRKKLKSQSKELSPYELQLYSLLTKTSVPVLKSAILWLHDTVDGFWSSWLTSPTHRVFLSTGCSPSLKTWSKKKSILCSRAFHHLTEFLLLISGLWSSLCVVSTYSMTLFGILKFGLFFFFFAMRSLSGEGGAKLHCAGWLPACSHSCLLCCGSSWTASSTLPCGYSQVQLY